MDRIWHQHYGNMPKDIEWASLGSMADVIETAFDRFGDRPAVHCLGTTLSYAQVDQASGALAAFLQQNWATTKVTGSR